MLNIKEKYVETIHEGVILEHFYAIPGSASKRLPAVLIFHAWSGRDDFACRQAREMAKKGYIGIAVDLYGKGKVGRSVAENQALMMPFLENRLYLKHRLLSLFTYFKTDPLIDFQKMVGIGYCFGGLCVIDGLRNNMGLIGVSSIHGKFIKPTYELPQKYKAKVQVIHGYKDPIVSYQQLREFEDELGKACEDFQIIVFGQGLHAFTNPEACDIDRGSLYNETLNYRTNILINNFLEELLPSSAYVAP